MEEFRLIEFHHARDFGKKINATVEFVKQNFLPLFKSILMIAGPAVFLGSLFMGSFLTDYFSVIFKSNGNSSEMIKYVSSSSFWVQISLMYLFLALSFVITIATINSYVLIYYQKKTNKIELSEVWSKAREILWKYLGSLLLLILCMILAVFAVVVVSIVLQKISAVAVVFFVIASIIGFIYVMVGISLAFFIQIFEERSFFEAASRSLQLIGGKWWSTLGISLILSLIGGAISYIFIIPYYIYIAVSAAHNVNSGLMEVSATFKTTSYIFLTVYYMAQMLLYVLPHVGLAFQYFNLVELKEARGLMSDIENFGKPAPNSRPEELH